MTTHQEPLQHKKGREPITISANPSRSHVQVLSCWAAAQGPVEPVEPVEPVGDSRKAESRMASLLPKLEVWKQLDLREGSGGADWWRLSTLPQALLHSRGRSPSLVPPVIHFDAESSFLSSHCRCGSSLSFRSDEPPGDGLLSSSSWCPSDTSCFLPRTKPPVTGGAVGGRGGAFSP